MVAVSSSLCNIVVSVCKSYVLGLSYFSRPKAFCVEIAPNKAEKGEEEGLYLKRP